MKTIICDICERPIRRRQYKIIIKKEWLSFTERGFEKLDVCEDCADKIIEEIKKKEERYDR